jgi:hypothetical protein
MPTPYGMRTDHDASFLDKPDDPSVALHQQEHDLHAGFQNRFDKDAVFGAGDTWVYDQTSGLLAAGRPDHPLRDDTLQSVTVSTATYTIDLSAGVNVFLTLHTTSVTLTVPTGLKAGLRNDVEVMVKQDSTGGRTLVWWSGIKWAGGSPPSISQGASAVDCYYLWTYNGTNWFGTIGGQGFS